MTWFNSENSYEMICILKSEPESPDRATLDFAQELEKAMPAGTRYSVLYLPPGAHGTDDPLRQRAELLLHYPARFGELRLVSGEKRMTIYRDYISHTASMSIEKLAPLLVEQIVNTCKRFSLGEPFGTLTIHLNERRTFADPLSDLALPAFTTTWILETT